MNSRAAFTLLILTITSLMACSDQRDTGAAGPGGGGKYSVDIRWTSYGIPHVKAEDWGSLGYGFAYATATDGVCVFAKEAATANGTLVADFGNTPEYLASDVFHRGLMTPDKLIHQAAGVSDELREFNAGFVAGYNRFIRDNEDSLPESCADADWVRPISEADLARMQIAFGIRYGLGFFKDAIADAAPPGEAVASVDLDFERNQGLGSNAIALGSELTETGRGILFGNPHYPWHGPSRFHMIHTTIPGVIDVMGASLLAGNFVGIGFNRNIAWTHTVSTAIRFSLFELELNPENPMQYRYADGFRDIETRDVTVPGGGEQTIYMTHYGPIVASRRLAWTRSKAYAIRDAILDNNTATATYGALQTATSVGDIEAAISKQGIFFVNTIAADRHGNAFYADISSTPYISQETLDNCRRTADGLPSSVIVLDGSDPSCEWTDDSRSTVPGNLPAELMPRATSTRYFTNSNDSYWLSNPDEPLEGYLPTIGPERTARTLRTRAGLAFLQERLDEDGKLNPDEVQEMLFSHRHFGAELLLDDVLTLCDDDTAIAASCEVLAGWDRTGNIDSYGMQIWTEFWEMARQIPNVYAVPFSADDPVNTPSGINVENPDVRHAVRQSLANAQAKLLDADIGLDAAWGDVQFAERNGTRIPVPGGPGRHGMFSFINTAFTNGKGYTPIRHGNSYIQVITWDEDGTPDARGILTYSQSPESDSPHYSDQTELYSNGEWIDLPFTEEEILADTNLRVLSLSE